MGLNSFFSFLFFLFPFSLSLVLSSFVLKVFEKAGVRGGGILMFFFLFFLTWSAPYSPMSFYEFVNDLP